jgi:hypothetical protein
MCQGPCLLQRVCWSREADSKEPARIVLRIYSETLLGESLTTGPAVINVSAISIAMPASMSW